MPSLNAVFRLNDGYSRVINSINRTTQIAERSILGASNSTDRLNRSIDRTQAVADKASGGIKRLVAVAGGLLGINKIMSVTDEFTNTQARLKLINDGLQTQKQLQDNIFIAAQRSRGAYSDMATTVAKLGMLAGNAFGSTQEIVDFTELINKSFKVGGSSKLEQQSGMYQLSQAMASGRLQGDEFRSIADNAPQIGQAIAKYLNIPIGQLKELSSEGLITADIIKNAMFSAADEINAQFATMPMTFADVGTELKNHAMYVFQEAMEKLREITNSDPMRSFTDNVKVGINFLANSFIWLTNVVQATTDFIANNWELISSILVTVGIVMISMMTINLYKAAAAWVIMWGSALWPIALVASGIGIVVFVLLKMGITGNQIIGGICGGFMVLLAVVWNIGTAIANGILYIAEFIANTFDICVKTVENLFMAMGYAILDIISKVAKKIEWLVNLIPDVEVTISGGLDNMANNLKNTIEANVHEKIEYDKFAYQNLGSSFDKGYNWGSNLFTGFEGLSIDNDYTAGLGDLSQYLNNGALPVTNGAGSGGSLNVAIDKEDIKYLKDIAEREYINKFTQVTLAPNVTFTGDIKETTDMNELSKFLEKMMKEEIAVTQEG